MKNIIYIFILFFIICSCQKVTFYPYDLECQNSYNTEEFCDLPLFSWKIKSHEKNQYQKAYHIMVASNLNLLENNKPDMMNSKKIESQQNIFIPYSGKELKSAKTYYWKIKVWNKNNQVGKWSKICKFSTGILNKSEFKAKWIGHPDSFVRSSIIRKELEISKEIKEAHAFVSGIGAFYFYINGKQPDEAFMDPGMTEYPHRVTYSSYNVTSMLNNGENTLGIMLGEGMGAYSYSRKNRHHNPGKTEGPFSKPMAWLQLKVSYQDGSQQTFITDQSWNVNRSHITYNNFFGGEDYNANLYPKGWNVNEFNDSDWINAEIMNTQLKPEARNIPPMKIQECFSPVVSLNPKPGMFLYDMGQNIGGIWKMKVKGKQGTVLRIRGSEKLEGSPLPSLLEEGKYPDMSVMHGRGGFFFRDCYSEYTLKGNETETYHPMFFYNGFRYLQIETDDQENIEFLEPQGCFVYTDLEESGDFECSDTLLNELHKMTDYTIKGIMQSVPTSNPHSEKYGWTGDIHLFSEAANFNLDMQNLWKNWLADVDASQQDLGDWRVTHIVPNYQEFNTATSATWGAVLPILVHNTYRYYNDKEIVETYYPNVKGWCDYLSGTANNNIVQGLWADHVPPGINKEGEFISRGRTPEISRLVATAYYYKTTKIVSELANILNKEEDFKAYQSLAREIKDSFNAEFLDEDLGYYQQEPSQEGYCVIQTANLLPLEFGMVPQDQTEKIIKVVLDDIRNHHNGNLYTGIIGTKSLVEVFSEYGLEDELLTIIHQEDYPGWGYWVKNGATTIWQNWSGTADHMHGMYGTVEEFNFNRVLGIQSPNGGKTTTGFENIYLSPWTTGKISWAKGYLDTPNGKVHVDWKKDSDDNLSLNIEIPVNSKATIELPGSYSKVFESDHEIKPEDSENNDDIQLDYKNHNLMLFTGSGKYSFELKKY